MTEIAVSSFGEFGLVVGGTRVAPPQSKAARELIVRAAVEPGDLAREHLADCLWPDETDIRKARRNLTRELNRAQEAVGARLWLSSRNTVRVSDDVVLVSDIAEVLSHLLGRQPSTAVATEHLLAVLNRGEFLPGHDTEWVQSIRYQLDAHRDRLRLGLGDFTSSERLGMQPTHTGLAEDVASGGALRQGTALHPGNHIPSKVEWARRRLDKLKHEGDKGRLIEVICELDDLLRQSGRIEERTQLWSVAEFALPGTEWRRAETAQMSGNRQQAALITEASTPVGNTDNERLQLAGADASDVCAISQIRELVERTTVGTVRREASLRLAFVLYQTGDLGAAESVATRVLIEAEQAHDAVLKTHASSTLGWILLETDDHRRAEFHLNEAISGARRCCADQVRASALAGIAALRDRQHRYASAVTAAELAAEITSGLGNVPLEGRYRMNLATGALKMGLSEIATQQLDWIDRNISPGSWQEHPTTAISAALPTDWVRTLRYRLDWFGGRGEQALRDAQTLLEQSVRSNYRQALACRVDLIEMLISSGRSDDAVEVARASVNDHSQSYTDTSSLIEKATLGAALVAAGSIERGGALIRTSIDSLGVVDRIPTFVLVQACRAATETPVEPERNRAYVEAKYRVESIRADLSATQWEHARQRVPAIADLVEFLEHESAQRKVEPFHTAS